MKTWKRHAEICTCNYGLLQKNFVFCNFTINICPFGQLDFNIYVKYEWEEILGSPGLSKSLNSTVASAAQALMRHVTASATFDWAIAFTLIIRNRRRKVDDYGGQNVWSTLCNRAMWNFSVFLLSKSSKFSCVAAPLLRHFLWACGAPNSKSDGQYVCLVWCLTLWFCHFSGKLLRHSSPLSAIVNFI